MQRPAHAAAQCAINQLVLLDAGQPPKRGAHHAGGIMVAVARQLGDFHPRVGNPLADQPFYVLGSHRHRISPYFDSRSCRRASTVFSSRARRTAWSVTSLPAAVRSPTRFPIPLSSPPSSQTACNTDSAWARALSGG